MHYLVDFGSLTAFALIQALICRRLLALASPRLTRRQFRRLIVSVALFYAVIGIGVAFSMAHMYGVLRGSARLASVTGGAVFLWLTSSSLSYILYRLFRRLSAGIPAFDAGRRRLIDLAGGAVAVSPFLVMAYGGFVQRTDFQVKELDIPVPDLPRDLEGIRLLQISDIHLSAFLSEAELSRVIDAANQTRAHIALVTGDLISSAGDPLDACLRQLARLRTDAGTFGCMGNHEHFAAAEAYTERAGARLGIRFLRQQTVPLRFGQTMLNVAGVDYQPTSRRRDYLHGAERLLAPGAINLLLSHNPDVFPVAARQGYNLMLSGHTHGGQVTVEILEQAINPARFYTPYIYGPYAQGRARAYVTRGIGTIGIPVRLGAPPEITVLRLRKA